jgi:putative peptidoglycan lipid II flippase
MMPFLLIVSLSALMMGTLNAQGRFGVPAFAPSLFNMAAITVGVILKIAGAAPQTAVAGWAIGTLLGGFLQFGIQVPPLWRDGYRFWPHLAGSFRDESVRRIARLMAPATLGLAATQVNILVNTQFASDQPGAVSWLNYAFRLIYLPVGIFGVAIATVTASSLARRAAERDIAGMKAQLSQGLRHVALLTIPCTVGLIALAKPIVGLIYERGRFMPADTEATALALVGYAIGLYAYSGVKVVAPAFYALDKTFVPLLASCCAVAVNLILNLAAHRSIGYLGLALGTALGAFVNLTVLIVFFRRLTSGYASPKGLPKQLVQVLTASLVMGAVIWGAWQLSDGWLAGSETVIKSLRMVRVLGGVALGAGTYLLVCRLIRISEIDEILVALLRRKRR